MQTLVLFAILALVASPIFAEEVAADKKVDKRGILGLGYGGYNGYYGLNGYGGYGHNGYLGSPSVYSVGHGIAPAYSHAYTAPHAAINHGYTAPIYTVPRLGYHSIGHGLNYLHGW
ncbi:prisilkin-39-like [Leptopilina heterotoma]|uniref:prisilkin-39-like n=1 Tax=Leptopilina heterotoma TaxID=63436 RepID=UPI001CA84CEE|nr:prisilkin-39-like [Leptopilina heterotoma]